MIVSVGIAIALSSICTPLLIALCKKNNWYDKPNPRKIHSSSIPRLGGVAVFFAAVVASLVYLLVFAPGNYAFLLPLLAGAVLIFFGGLVDDVCNLHARIKLLIQLVAAGIVAVSPFYFKDVLGFSIPPLFGRLITFVWIIAIINSLNLIDGLDWLCGGISFVSLLTLGMAFRFFGFHLGNLCFILCGALVGFLIFNRPPARIFIGDCGSQTFGYIIAVAPLMESAPVFDDIKPLIMLLLVSLPGTDVIAAIWRRTRDHRSLFSTDRAHIHHKFINIGFSTNATIFFLLFLQSMICFSSYCLLFMPGKKATLVLFSVATLLLWMLFGTIHYINRTVNQRLHGKLDANPQKEY